MLKGFLKAYRTPRVSNEMKCINGKMTWNTQDKNLSSYVPKAKVDHTISGQETGISTLDHSATTPNPAISLYKLSFLPFQPSQQMIRFYQSSKAVSLYKLSFFMSDTYIMHELLSIGLSSLYFWNHILTTHANFMDDTLSQPVPFMTNLDLIDRLFLQKKLAWFQKNLDLKLV